MTYALGNRVSSSATHRVYESLQANNTNHDPTIAANRTTAAGVGTYWLDVGPTNRTAMFDGLISTQTSAVGPLVLTLRPGAFNGFALFGVDADSYSVTVKDAPGGNVIYSEPTTPLEGSMPSDYYDYFFAPFQPLRQLVRTSIDPYSNAELTLTFNRTTGNVGIGMLAVGLFTGLGIPQRDAEIDFTDYTLFKTDAYGNSTVVKRPNATNLSVTAIADIARANSIKNTINTILGTPVVVSASGVSGYEWLTVFGLMSATFTPPPAVPQRGDRTTFSARVDAFLTWMANLIPQLTAFLAALTNISSGGAFSIPYTIDLSSTADADPGNGVLRFNAAAQNAATTLFLDLLSSDNVDYTAMLDQFDASTSLVKGALRIVSQTDPTKFLTYSVTARTTAAGYRKVTVTPINGSSASPFTQGDQVVVKFTRTGDKGDTGVFGIPMVHVREEQAANTNSGTAPTALGTNLYRCALNTVKQNDISGASLSTNQLTLPAGKYLLRGKAVVTVTTNSGGYSAFRGYLYNVTDGAVISNGTTGQNYNPNTSQTQNLPGQSEAVAIVTFASAKTIDLRAYGAQGLAAGYSAGNGGGAEVFSELIVEKIG
ncbi:hypothetical protein Q3G72_029596 [Acer saccharum]|nr:hypothetical protein Q3G72_029596 [Acer saccharum]